MTVKHLYPNSTTALNLNFKSSRVVDPRISFVRNSTATYVDPVSGLVKTAPANVARVDKNGLLVEESRTNSIAYSVVFTLAYGASNITATDNVAGAPDGTTTAASLMETNSTGFKNFYRGEITSGAAGNYAQSIFVKDNGRAYVNLRWFSISVSNCWHTVTFALIGDGSITQEQSGSGANFTNISRSIEHIGNGWYRITLGATNPNARIYPWILDGSDGPTPTLNSLYGVVSYTGDVTKGYYIWGAQVETGTFSTSYIPTSGATVTRAEDVCAITPAEMGSFYPSTGGTFVFTTSARNSPKLFISQNGSHSNRTELNRSGTQARFTVNSGGAQVNNAETVFSADNADQHKIAFRLANPYKVAVNGNSTCSNAGGSFNSPPNPNLNRIDIGINQQGVRQNGPIQNLSFYPSALSDTALEALTQ